MKFIKFINDNNLGIVEQNKSLKELTTFKIGGHSKYFVYPKGIFELSKIIKYCYQNNMKYYVLGNCSNVLISDDYFEVVFISLKFLNTIKSKENIYMLGGGLKAPFIGYHLLKKGFEEAIPLALIPGTIGGVIYMNGSCFKRNIDDILEKVVFLTKTGQIKIRKKPFGLEYRNSCFQNNECIILIGIFKFNKLNINSMNLFKKYLNIKKTTQPLNTFNAGSIFKNPKDFLAWELIEKAGLRGYSVGDAEVSKKHCNFLINKNNSTFNEMLALIYFVKYKVLSEFNIELETEIKIITPQSI